MTFWICFGKYARLHISKRRICLGWVSIVVAPFDVEMELYKLSQEVIRLSDKKD